MDGIITPEQLQALEAQASLEQQEAQRRAMLSNLQKDAALVAKYSDLARQSQVQQPFATTYFGQLGPASPIPQVPVQVPASERFQYAQKAAELESEMNRKIFPVQPNPLNIPSEATQPKPATTPSTPAEPSANTPAPAPEKPKYDPFAEFNNYEKTRKKFFSIAFKYVSQVPIQYQDEALKLVKEEWDNTGPSLPKSTLLPLKHPATGEILKDQALTADGRIVELKAPAAEKALTESQSKALQFATAMKEADQQVTDLLKRSNYDPTNPLNTLPMFETLKSQDRKLYEGTVRDFAVAILRRTSGAHVSPQEFKITEETYFPQSGDSEAVLKAKERRRKRDVASVYADVPESIRGEIFNQNQQQQSAPGGPPTVFTLVPGQKSLVPAR